MTSTSLGTPPLTVHDHSHPSSTLSIGSLVHPSTSQSYHTGNITLSFDQYAGSAGPLYPTMVHAPSADTEGFMYSSPESSQSPISDHYPQYPNHRNSISSSTSITDYYNPPVTSPLISTTIPGWTPVLPPSVLPSHVMREEGSVLPSVGIPSSSVGRSSTRLTLSQALQYQYPSPTWTGMSGLHYGENLVPPPESFRAMTGWKSSTL